MSHALVLCWSKIVSFLSPGQDRLKRTVGRIQNAIFFKASSVFEIETVVLAVRPAPSYDSVLKYDFQEAQRLTIGILLLSLKRQKTFETWEHASEGVKNCGGYPSGFELHNPTSWKILNYVLPQKYISYIIPCSLYKAPVLEDPFSPPKRGAVTQARILYNGKNAIVVLITFLSEH